MGAPELLHHLRGAGLVLTLTPAGGLHVAPRSALTEDQRNTIRAERDALVLALEAEAASLAPPPPAQPRRSGNPLLPHAQATECHAGGWNDGEIARFQARVGRLVGRGFAEADAEHLAERLVLRDRNADDRVVCAADCRHYRPGRCGNHRAALLDGPDIGAELAALLQRCPGWAPVADGWAR